MAIEVISILKDHTPSLHWIRPDATAHDALALMAANGIAAVLVMENGKLHGIFSGKDYATRVVLHGRNGMEVPVREVMTSAVATIDPRVSVTECMEIMTAKRIRHLPIMENGEVVGLVTLADLVRYQLSHKQFEIDQLTSYISG